MATITRQSIFFDKTMQTQRRIFLYTGPASYSGTGDSITAESLALGRLIALLGDVAWSSTNANTYLLAWDATNKVIHWFVPNTNVEVAAAVNLSTYSEYMEAIGQ